LGGIILPRKITPWWKAALSAALSGAAVGALFVIGDAQIVNDWKALGLAAAGGALVGLANLVVKRPWE
jgi:hypothetical protein